MTYYTAPKSIVHVHKRDQPRRIVKNGNVLWHTVHLVRPMLVECFALDASSLCIFAASCDCSLLRGMLGSWCVRLDLLDLLGPLDARLQDLHSLFMVDRVSLRGRRSPSVRGLAVDRHDCWVGCLVLLAFFNCLLSRWVFAASGRFSKYTYSYVSF